MIRILYGASMVTKPQEVAVIAKQWEHTIDQIKSGKKWGDEGDANTHIPYNLI